MVRLLTLFLALAASPAFAIVNPSQQTFVACGKDVMVPPGISLPGPGVSTSSVIALGCRATGANTYCSARRANGTQAYTVSTGKTMRIFHACSNPGSATTDTLWVLGYGSSDVGFASGSAPTSYSSMFNDTVSLQINSGIYTSPLNPGRWMDFDVPAGKSVAAQTNASNFLWIYGYEY